MPFYNGWAKGWSMDTRFKHIIPALSPDEYKQLELNILKDGIREPLVVWGDTLIDGHNRLSIAQAHGLDYATVNIDFPDDRTATEWIILNQFGRRNISAYDRARLALELKPIIAEKARENQRGGQGGVLLPQISAKATDTRQELANIAGVSHDTISKVEKIETSPDISAKVKSGELSINQGYQAVKRAEKVLDVERRIDEHKQTQTGIIDIYNTDKRYSIIYADPAWDYWSGGNKNQSLHYQTMTIDDICALPVKDIADESCVLFLWVTFPILQDCFKVIESWGFKYSTAGFVWVKKNRNADTPFIGCGAWTRANSELCLIATKGNVTRLDAGISQVIEAPIEEHSKKPSVTRELITRLVGELPRIELFSRNAVDGWDAWGNEIEHQ
jgi:N6-adenosine-specific RNA methylase IME4/DNA-binding XRE family transcriptional regulator